MNHDTRFAVFEHLHSTSSHVQREREREREREGEEEGVASFRMEMRKFEINYAKIGGEQGRKSGGGYTFQNAIWRWVGGRIRGEVA